MSDANEARRCFLIAMPQLMDPNFFQTTSLLSEFNEQGAMGVVLNRPLGITLAQVLEKSPETPSTSPAPVYWGGPVQTNTGWIVHEDRSLAAESMTIEEGLYLSSSPKVLKKLTEEVDREGSPRYRFFLGYAGWGAGQLEKEIAGASWVTAPLNRDLIFDGEPQTIWKRSLATIGVDPVTLAATPQTDAN